MCRQFDDEAANLKSLLPHGPWLGILGSTSLHHEDSDWTCSEIGHQLASIPALSLLTGGVGGVGETVGRAFFRARQRAGHEPGVYHILPRDCRRWDYGQTLYAGDDMYERREVLARLARLYVAVEGGPGTAHEAQVALDHGALVLPVGRLGGHAGQLYEQLPKPAWLESACWSTLGSATATCTQTALALCQAVTAFFGPAENGSPMSAR